MMTLVRRMVGRLQSKTKNWRHNDDEPCEDPEVRAALSEMLCQPERVHTRRRLPSIDNVGEIRESLRRGANSEQIAWEELEKSGEIAGWGTLSFDAICLEAISRGRALASAACLAMWNQGLVSKFDMDTVKLARFLREVEEHQYFLPYHCPNHISEVLNMTTYFLTNCIPAIALTSLEKLSLIFAATVHDIGHPGVSNGYLIKTLDEIAVRYNDRSPLENHHAALAFSLLLKPGNNFLERLSPDQFREFRRLVLEAVLATDMANHFEVMSDARSAFRPQGIMKRSGSEMEKGYETTLIVKILIKTADLCHAFAPLAKHRFWVSKLKQEYFRQGEMENSRAMPISPLMDPDGAGIEKSQHQFFTVVILPLLSVFDDIFINVPADLSRKCKTNHEFWTGWCESDEKGTEVTGSSVLPVDILTVLGGVEGIMLAVSLFYERVLGDPKLDHYFEGVDMLKLQRKQVRLLTHVFQDNPDLDIDMMREMHSSLDPYPDETHFDAIAGHLAAVLESLHVDKRVTGEAIRRLLPLKAAFPPQSGTIFYGPQTSTTERS